MTADMSEVSDGYHTFSELYAHRTALFSVLMELRKEISWKSKKHSDSSMYNGWFIAGMDLPSGPITYHLPMEMWDKLSGIKEVERAPEWDGHTSQEVLKRLAEYCRSL